MRIVIATAVYYPQVNGVAVFSHNLACGLAARGHEVLVICPSLDGKSHRESKDGVQVQYLKSVDVKVYPDQVHKVPEKKQIWGIEWPRLFYRHGLRASVFPSRKIAQVLDEFRPDIVHVQVSDPIGLSVVGWARRANVPVVTTEHNQPEVLTDSLKMPKFLKKGANGLLYAYFRNRQKKRDFVTMPTELAIKNLLSKGEIGVPIAAVSNGVNLGNFKPGEAPEEIYEKYGISREAPVVLYVGRVDSEKKVGVVVQAFFEVHKKVPKAKLVIVGDGVDRARLEVEVERRKMTEAVKFLGRVLPPDLYELYKIGDVFVTASEIETQGIVLIEAAAVGLPLIAVDAGAVAEVCQDGVNGILCKPGDARGVSKAIEKILTDEALRKKFAKKSLEIAHGHDFEKTLDQFINIYSRLIKRQD